MTSNLKRLSIFLIGLLAGTALLSTTYRHGPGISPDSVFYLGTAERMLSGYGYSMPFDIYVQKDIVEDIPVIQWPPLYPATVAVIKISTGLSILQAAAIVNAVAFAFIVILIAHLVLSIAPTHYLTALTAAFAYVVSVDVVNIYYMAWSEPLYNVLLFGGLLSISRYIVKGERLYYWIATVAIGLCISTRYVGQIAVFVCLLGILFLRRDQTRKVLKEAIVFGVVASSPYILWSLRNYLLTGYASNRSMRSDIGMFTGGDVYDFLSTISRVIFPALRWNITLSIQKLLLVTLIFMFVLYICYSLKGSRRIEKGSTVLKRVIELSRQHPLIPLLSLYSIAHTGTIFLAICCFDPGNAGSFRLLSPVLLVIFVLFPVFLSKIATGSARDVIVISIAVFFFVPSGHNVLKWYDDRSIDVKPRWYMWGITPDTYLLRTISETIDDSTIIYTNKPIGIYYALRRPVYLLPNANTFDSSDLIAALRAPRRSVNYDSIVANDFVNRRAVVAWHGTKNEVRDSILSRYNLELRTIVEDGAIYYPRESAVE